VNPLNRWNRLYKRLRKEGKKHNQALIRIATYMLNETYQEAQRSNMYH